MISFWGCEPAGEVYQKPDESVAPERVPGHAPSSDLNGDGKLEVIVHSFYYEGGQTTIYRCELDKIEAVSLSNAEFERHKFDVPKHANSSIKMPWICSAHSRDIFGHDQFRPLQREIVQDALAGQDVFMYADRRREIALFSVASIDARGPNHRGVAAHRAHERSSGRAANQWNSATYP